MKIKLNKTYKPVSINITLDTEEEFNEFYAIFNTVCICDSTLISTSKIRDILDNSGVKYKDGYSAKLTAKIQNHPHIKT